MVDLKKLQKEIYQNKVDKGFNVTDVNKEFCLTYGEVAEAYEAWRKKKDNFSDKLHVIILKEKNMHLLRAYSYFIINVIEKQ